MRHPLQWRAPDGWLNPAGRFVVATALGARRISVAPAREVRRRAAIFLLATAVLLFAGPAEARVWTDKQGNKTSAEFVRIHQGQVILKKGNQVLRFPPDGFCEEDLDYIRSKASPEQLQQLPPVEQNREWKNVQGKTLVARLAGVEQGKLKFRRADSAEYVLVPIESLAAEDQRIAREALRAKGLEGQLPPNQAGPPPGSAPPMANPAGVAPAPGAAPGFAPAPGFVPAPGFAPAPGTLLERLARQREERRRQQEEQRQRLLDEQRRQQEQFARMEADRKARAQQQQLEQQQLQQRMVEERLAARPQPIGASPGSNGQPNKAVEIFNCASCNRQLPVGVKIGDKCPHCGAVIQFISHADGRVDMSPSYKMGYEFVRTMGPWLGLACVGFVLLVMILVVVLLVKLIMRPAGGSRRYDD